MVQLVQFGMDREQEMQGRTLPGEGNSPMGQRRQPYYWLNI